MRFGPGNGRSRGAGRGLATGPGKNFPKKLPEVAGEPSQPRSISALRVKDCEGKGEWDKTCYKGKQELNTTPKGEKTLPMQYDVLLPGGKPVAGLIPWTAGYNEGKSDSSSH